VLANLTSEKLRLSTGTNETTSRTVSFTNTSDIPLEYLVTNSNTFFGVSPSGGSVPPGSTETLTVSGECGESAVELSNAFYLTGNFAASEIAVTLDCGSSLPSVFTEETYEATLVHIFTIINNISFSGPYAGYGSLVSAIFDNKTTTEYLREVSRSQESLGSNSDFYSVKYECVAGGSVNAERKGSQFDAEFFNCKIAGFVLNGKLLDSGFIASPRQFFATFSDVSAKYSEGEQRLSGSYTYTTDATNSAIRYSDIQYTFDNGSSYYTVSDGYTSATKNVGVYESEFEFNIVGNITNNRNFKVKSDSIDKIKALEGSYYTQGNFTVNEVDGDGELKIEPGVFSPETFQLSISEFGSTTAKPVAWSKAYYFLCGIDTPTVELTSYICREK